MPSEKSEEWIEAENTKRRETAWEVNNDAVVEGFKSVIAFATEALRSAMLISSGSSAAALAILSQTLKDRQLDLVSSSVLWALVQFAVAFLLSAIASALSYVAQVYFAQEPSEKKYIDEFPWVEDTDQSKLCKREGDHYRSIAMFFVAGSLVLILTGYGTAFIGIHAYLAK